MSNTGNKTLSGAEMPRSVLDKNSVGYEGLINFGSDPCPSELLWRCEDGRGILDALWVEFQGIKMEKISGNNSLKSRNNVDFSCLTPSYPDDSFFLENGVYGENGPIGLPQSLLSAGKSWIWVLKWKRTFLRCLDNSQGSVSLL